MAKIGIVSTENNKYISNISVPLGITASSIETDKGNPVVYRDFIGKEFDHINTIKSTVLVDDLNTTGIFTVGTSFRITTITNAEQADFQTTLSSTSIAHVIEKINELEIPGVRASSYANGELVSFQINAENKYIQITNIVNDFLSQAKIEKNSQDNTYAISIPSVSGYKEVVGYKDDDVTLADDLYSSDNIIKVNNGHNLLTPPVSYITISSAARLTSSSMKTAEINFNINTEDEYFIPLETRSSSISGIQSNIAKDNNCKQNRFSISSKYTEEKTFIYGFSGQFCIDDGTLIPPTTTQDEIYSQSISRFIVNTKEYQADRYTAISGNHVSKTPPSFWIDNGTKSPTRIEYWHLTPFIRTFNVITGYDNYYDEINASLANKTFDIIIKGRTVTITFDSIDNLENVFGSMLNPSSLRGVIESINSAMNQEEIPEFAAGLKKINDEYAIVFISTIPYQIVNGTADLSLIGLSETTITQNDLIWNIRRFYTGTKASKSSVSSDFDSYLMVSNANRTNYNINTTPGKVDGSSLSSIDDISEPSRNIEITDTAIKLSSVNGSIQYVSDGVTQRYNLPFEYNSDRILISSTHSDRVSIVSGEISDNSPLVSGLLITLNNYTIKTGKENSSTPVILTPSDINISTDTITLPVGHGLLDNDNISFKPVSGSLPLGLDVNTIYIASITGSDLQIQRSDGSIVDLTSAGSDNFYIFRSSSLSDLSDAIRFLRTEIDGSTDINTGTDEISIPNHLFNTNDPIILSTISGVLPDELSVGITYYAIKIDSNTIKLAPFENANPINLNGSPSGDIFISLQENLALTNNIGPFRTEQFDIRDLSKLLIYLPEDGTLIISTSPSLPLATGMSLPDTIEDAIGILTGSYILPAGGHPSIANARNNTPMLLPYLNHIKTQEYYKYNDHYLPGRNDIDIDDPDQYVINEFGNPDPYYTGVLPDYNIDLETDEIVFATDAIPEEDAVITIKMYIYNGNISYNSADDFTLTGRTKTNNVRVSLAGHTSDYYGTIYSGSTSYPTAILLDTWNDNTQISYPSGSRIHLIDNNIIIQDYKTTIQGNQSIYDSSKAPATAARSGNRESFF